MSSSSNAVVAFNAPNKLLTKENRYSCLAWMQKSTDNIGFFDDSYPNDASTAERVFWIVRSWCWNHPLPRTYRSWTGEDIVDKLGKEYDTSTHYLPILMRSYRAWRFLEPFFAANGYFIYHPDAQDYIMLARGGGTRTYITIRLET